MGYTSDGDVADLCDVSAVDRCADRITGRVGEFLHERVTRHTPVAERPPGVDSREWDDARGGRQPGDLKRSWKVGEVTVEAEATGEHRRIDVYTDDPVAPHVEWDTLPHIIVPKDPDGWLRFWDSAGDIVFAQIVHHPGTRGQHMMATALAETAAAWKGIAAEEVALWARTYARGGPPPLGRSSDTRMELV
jgi:hypothetical protein